MRTSGKLGLETFAPGSTGWGTGMNNNMRTIDTQMTVLNNRSRDTATDVEKTVAKHTATIMRLLQESTADYTLNAEVVKTAAVTEIKSYVDSLLEPHIQSALNNQQAVTDVITTLRSTLDTLAAQITTAFNTLEETINASYSDLTSSLNTKYSSVQTMRDQLLAQLNTIALKVDDHLTNLDNPHRVTFEQAGGSAAVKYVADTNRDGRYL